MGLELLSTFSRVTKIKSYTGADAMKQAFKDATDLANASNVNISANVIINGVRIMVPGYQTKDSADQNGNLEITKEQVGKISDPAAAARKLATEQAAKRGITTTVTVLGIKFTAQPPARPTELKNAAKGTPGTVAGTNVIEKNLRLSAINDKMQSMFGSMGGEDDDTDSQIPGQSAYEDTVQYGIAREANGRVSTLEGLLEGVGAGALKGVLDSLPGVFKSMLPIGALPGILKSSPIPLNSLLGVASGNALGSVAGQALRSVSGGISSFGGLTSALGAVGVGSAAVRTVYTPGTAVLSNVVGKSITSALVGNRSNIPVSRRIYGTVANVAINCPNRNIGFPIHTLGTTTSSSAFGSISSVIGSAVGARVPILPTNLSVGAIIGGLSGLNAALQGAGDFGGLASLSGLGQNLAQGDVANMFSPAALSGALPSNISSLLDGGIPPRTSNPFGEMPNDITMRRMFSPSQRTNLPTGGQRPPVDSPSGNAMKNGNIDYGLVISPGGRTLGEFSTKAIFAYTIPKSGQLGVSFDQIVEGLKYIATNVVDPLDKAFGRGRITNGFRGPGGTGFGKSDHCYGAAVDLQWGSASKHYEVAQFVAKYIKTDQVLLEFKFAGDSGHVHIAAGPNVRNKNKSLKVGTSLSDGRSFKPGLQRPTWS